MDKKLIGIGLIAVVGLIISLALTGQNEVASQAPALTTTRDSVTEIMPSRRNIKLE